MSLWYTEEPHASFQFEIRKIGRFQLRVFNVCTIVDQKRTYADFGFTGFCLADVQLASAIDILTNMLAIFFLGIT